MLKSARSARACTALLVLGAACARVQAPLATAVPVTIPSNGNVQPRSTEAAIIQQGYPRNDSAFVAPPSAVILSAAKDLPVAEVQIPRVARDDISVALARDA